MDSAAQKKDVFQDPRWRKAGLLLRAKQWKVRYGHNYERLISTVQY